MSSCPSHWLQKPKMLQLVPGKQREKDSGETYPVLWREKYIKDICGWESNDEYSNYDWVTLIIHWDESQVGFSPPSYKPSPAVCWEVMWPGKEGVRIGGEEQTSKVRPPPLLKSCLYSSGNTLYLCWAPQQHTAALTTNWIHLVDNQNCFIFYLFFILFFTLDVGMHFSNPPASL